MKKLMQNDIFLRVISLVIAFLCWIYVVLITNPEIEVKISGIPITLADHHTIKAEGYIVSNTISDTVDIKVKGTRQMLADLDRDSVSAYVDLTECTDKKSYELPVNIKLPYENITLVSKSIHKVTVSVDNYITREFPVSYTHTGKLKSTDYTVEETILQTPSVQVSGPESTIKTIEKATVVIDLDNASGDISGFAPVRLLNSNDDEVSLNNVDIKNKDISFKCVVYGKIRVDVKAAVSNEEGEYKCKVIDYPTITLAGPASDLETILVVETKPFYVNSDSLPMEYTAELMVPENITVEEEIKTVNVLVEKNDKND